MDDNDQRTRTPFGTSDDALRASVAARIADIVGVPAQEPATVAVPSPLLPLERSSIGATDADTIDVRTYLLDPPASPDDLARSERRARIVRIGSLVGCAVLAVILLAPMPGGGASSKPSARPGVGSEPKAAVRAATPGADADPPTSVSSLPRRVDGTPVARVAKARVDTRAAPARGRAPRPRRSARVEPSRSSPTPVPARPAVVVTKPASTTAPVPAPAPTPKPVPKPTPKPPVPEVTTPSTDAVLVPLG